MSIKLIAFDVDGTFVGDDHLKINEKNIEAMKMAYEQGIKVVMSTGRTQSISQKEIDDVGCVDYMVLSNGAIVVDKATNEVIKSSYISKEAGKKILKILVEHNAVFQIYAGQEAYVNKYSYDNFLNTEGLPEVFLVEYRKRMKLTKDLQEVVDNVPIEKFNVDYVDTKVVQEIMDALSKIPNLVYTAGFVGNIEITGTGADKGNGLAWLSDKLGIKAEEVMAFGDSGNDVTMLKWAGESYALVNGNEKAKSAAKHITKSDNNAGGVGEIIFENLTKNVK